MADNLTKTEYAKKRGDDMLLKKFKGIIREAEGLKLEAYKPDDTEEFFTIGFGHYGDDVEEGSTISEEEAEAFLDEDVRERIESISDMLPDFDTYPDSLRDALFSEHFRGSIGDSPDTRDYINEGDFVSAAEEYLDNDEYRNAEAKGIGGIRKRMEKVSEELMKLTAQN
tara:strand:+ start:652 stop:1158 length:507 start_codon:yes stop_codon:yes gene_type:complete